MPDRVFRFASAFKIMTFYLFQELRMNNGGGNNETFYLGLVFVPLSICSPLCERTNKSQIQLQFFGVGIEILRTLGFSNSSLLIWNIHQQIPLADYLCNLRNISTERFSNAKRTFSVQFNFCQVGQNFKTHRTEIHN